MGLARAATLTKDRTISGFLRYFESIGSGDAFRRMCVLDALILNVDRHSGNFGVLYDNGTMQVQKMTPVFDNNRSLLFDLDGRRPGAAGAGTVLCLPDGL